MFEYSDFVDIFDVDWFISHLARDVTIVKRVPDKFMRSMEKPPYTMRVPRKSEPDYYLDQVLPILLRRQVCGHYVFEISQFIKTYLDLFNNCQVETLATWFVNLVNNSEFSPGNKHVGDFAGCSIDKI